jgi:hypothetical protein
MLRAHVKPCGAMCIILFCVYHALSCCAVLCCVGVTVHELGQVYRGPYSFVYWSPTCSKYRHAYPVSITAGSSDAESHALITS